MGDIRVQAERREELGKNANRRLRARGRIPGVMYGRGLDAVAVSVDPEDLDRILHSETGHNTIFKIDVDGTENEVLIKDYQLDPVLGELVHADFQAVSMDRKMTFEVRVQPDGSAPGVTAGGILEMVLREIQVECLPGDVPDHFLVDVSALEIGDTVRVSDLDIATSKVPLLSESDLVVITVVPPQKAAEPEEVEVEVEEGEEEPEVIGKGKEEAAAAEQPEKQGKAERQE